MSLLVMLSSMTYWFYSSSVASRDRGMKEADKLRLARVVLDRLATEIRQASASDVEGRVGITGDHEQIWLLTSRVPQRALANVRAHDDTPAGEYDLEKVEYRIARHPDVLNPDGYPEALGLARVEILTPKPFDPSMRGRTQQPAAKDKKDDAKDGKHGHADGRNPPTDGADGSKTGESGDPNAADQAAQDLLDALLSDEAATDTGEDISAGPDIKWEELYAPEIHYLRFCYYDGKKWWDQWEVAGDNPLPQLVQVTIGFESHPPLTGQFGQQISKEKWNDEFCECLNREPVDCFPLAEDQYTTVVRVAPSDPLFRSRITREGQNVLEKLNEATKEMGQ